MCSLPKRNERNSWGCARTWQGDDRLHKELDATQSVRPPPTFQPRPSAPLYLLLFCFR